jgi:predicted hydrocarbon binding protein
MSKIKAHLLIGAIDYVREGFGQDELQQVIDKLPAEDKILFSKKIVPLTWVEAQIFNRFLETVDMILGKKDYYLCREIGRYQAEKGVNTFYQMFIRAGNTAFVLKRAHSFWRSLHDEGELIIQITGEKSVRARLLNYREAGKAFCTSLIGYFERVLEMSGAKDVEIFEAKCQAKGGEYCEFLGNWE